MPRPDLLITAIDVPNRQNLQIQFPDRRALSHQLGDPLPFGLRDTVQYRHLPTKIQLGQDEAVALIL
jgi:hypothetical protein